MSHAEVSTISCLSAFAEALGMLPVSSVDQSSFAAVPDLLPIMDRSANLPFG